MFGTEDDSGSSHPSSPTPCGPAHLLPVSHRMVTHRNRLRLIGRDAVWSWFHVMQRRAAEEEEEEEGEL